MFTTILRFIIIFLMCVGSLYYITTDGVHIAPVFNFKEQIKYLAQVFGNTLFVFIYHHSISGIIYPVRPQRQIGKMFMYSNIIATFCLWLEAMIAFLAFSSLKNSCTKPEDVPSEKFKAQYPCMVSGLFNENFLDLPFIGQICNFYPMMNIAAVPILNITLRNNLLEALPIKK